MEIMKKFLLLALVAIASVTANAQKFTLNVETKAPKRTANMLSSNNMFAAANNAVASRTMKKAPGESVELIEVSYSKSAGKYEDKVDILETCSVEITETGETGTYKGQTLPKIELNGFGAGYCSCVGYLDDAAGKIYIPRQVAYSYKDYGEMYLEALYVNAAGQLDWDGLDVVLTRDAETGIWCCWEGSEDAGDRVGWIILMTGEYDGEVWTYGIEPEYLVPNGEEHAYYNWGQGYAADSYPVYIQDLGDEVYIYNFLGMTGLDILVEDGEAYIPVGQPVADMPAAAYGEEVCKKYGEYFRLYRYDVVDEEGHLEMNEEEDYAMATLTSTKIDMGEYTYFGVWSKFDEDMAGYRMGMFGGFNWTLTDGSTFKGATAIKDVKANSSKSGRLFNLAGQQVKAGTKGILVKDGKKFINK